MMDFKNIGAAIRWLRTQRTKKQREVARAAGITPAMLSAYETGKHRPSLDTTERVLAAMGCDVIDLTNALHVVFEAQKSAEAKKSQGETESSGTRADQELIAAIPDTLGLSRLDPEEREVLGSLLPGILRLIRYLKR